MVQILHFGEVHIGKNARNCRDVADAYLPISRRHADVYAKKGHRQSDDPSPWRPNEEKRDGKRKRSLSSQALDALSEQRMVRPALLQTLRFGAVSR